jgi:hypothetical protein
MLGVVAAGTFVSVGVSAKGAIFQTASPYTDAHSDQVGSTNLLRDLWGATITNDAVDLIVTLQFNPAANMASGGAFNYGIGITTGNPNAGGDLQTNATTHGNPYNRTISIDSSLGGMTDWVGIFGAGGSGSGASPYTSYGYNDYFWVPSTSSPPGAWSKFSTVASGQPLFNGSGSNDSTITVTVPMSDFSNLSLTPGTTFDFDIYSTGTGAGQTAYDSLADQSPTNGTNSPTTQYNGTVLDSYTIQQVPEPAALGLLAFGGVGLMKRRARKWF